MTLDQRADAAVRELLAATDVDVTRRLADLRATRRRRDAGRVAALAVAAAALVGATAWVATGTDDDRIEPAPAPTTRVSNGALVGVRDESVRLGAWRVLEGPDVAHLPDARVARHSLQFTADGQQMVTVDGRDRVLEVDVATGTTTVIGTCPDVLCQMALSPDGSTLAWGHRDGLLLETVGGGSRVLDLDEGAGAPTWSPDGSALAFVSQRGVRVVSTDGTGVRTVYPTPDDDLVFDSAFSPDGTRLAFVLGEPRPGGDVGEYDFSAVVVGVDGTGARQVLAAGHCACVGLPVPSLTWSPDGSWIAVATTQGGNLGVNVVRPDGSDGRLVAHGVFADLAWQPVLE